VSENKPGLPPPLFLKPLRIERIFRDLLPREIEDILITFNLLNNGSERAAVFVSLLVVLIQWQPKNRKLFDKKGMTRKKTTSRLRRSGKKVELNTPVHCRVVIIVIYIFFWQ